MAFKVSSELRRQIWLSWWKAWIECSRDPAVMTTIDWDSQGRLYVFNIRGQKYNVETWKAKPEQIRNRVRSKADYTRGRGKRSKFSLKDTRPYSA